jgi:hypothetical protein
MEAHETATVEAIRTYLKHGLAVIPIRAGEKLPCEPWQQWATQRPDRAQWSAWWAKHAGCNVAVVYASSEAPDGRQLVCCDTDTPEAESWVKSQTHLPATPTVQTVHGWHRYYYAPADLEHATAQDGKPEVRAGVHYSLLPPSQHPDGPEYEWAFGLGWGEVGVADLPPWGGDLMQKKAVQADAEERDPQEPVPQGRRNETLFRQVAKWWSNEVPEEQLWVVARAYNETRCVPPLDQDEVDRIVKSVLRYPAGTSVKRQIETRPLPPEPQEQPDSTESLMASAERAVNAAGAYTPPEAIVPVSQSVADLAGDIILSAEARRTLPRGIYGLRSGWASVDAHFGGFKWERLILLMGSSGIGKTTLARHFLFATIEHIRATRSDARILFYALEGGLEQFLWYYAGYAHDVPIRCWQPGGDDVTDSETKDRMMAAYAEFADLPLVLSEERDGDRIMFDIERHAAVGEVEAVILDNLQELRFAGGNEWQRNKLLATRFADFAKSTDIPIVVLSQVNEFKGQADSPRGGPEWYHKAGVVLTAKRGENGCSQEEKQQSNVTRLVCCKHRYAVHGYMPEKRLAMDLVTRRMFEETDLLRLEAARSAEGRTPAEQWAGNQ